MSSLVVGQRVRISLIGEANPTNDIFSLCDNSLCDNKSPVRWETGVIERVREEENDQGYRTYDVRDETGKLWEECFFPDYACPFPNRSQWHGDIWPLPLLDDLAEAISE